MNKMKNVQTYRFVVIVTVAVAVSWGGCVLPAEAAAAIDFPSPLAGPGVDTIKRSQKKKIEKGWKHLVAGDLEQSRKRIARLTELTPAQLLDSQTRLVEGDEAIVDDLLVFCQQNPEYAAAWITLSVAAERADRELIAIRTARRARSLWATSPWADRASDLEQRWITDRITEAERLFEEGQNGAAAAELGAADALGPLQRDSILLGAKILFAEGHLDKAADLLGTLPDDFDARYLEGQIAESLRNWKGAMDAYSSLPEDYPQRSPALRRAKVNWRLTLLPAYARESMVADQVTRSDLAVILVSIQPQLETLPGGEVPVMSDIVDHPGQREIITVVRLGIMNADRRDHLFFPDTEADVETIREAIQRSRTLLGLTAPVWCPEPGMVGSVCTSISVPTSGETIVNAVIDVVSGAGP